MAELQYGLIPQLEEQVKSLSLDDTAKTKLVRTAVTEAEIAEVVSKATGIPVTKMMEGERQKLVKNGSVF